jgi:DNA-binding response OmpR family regulator
MDHARVLIVEDDFLIALDVEHALEAAGYEVCGTAASEVEALQIAERLRPDMAVVDISLSPGDGRVVAKALCGSYATKVLFATGQCDEVATMTSSGAVACLPKPYHADDVPIALRMVVRLAGGETGIFLPKNMFALTAGS